MAKDPVCGMEVDERDAEFITRLDHETFYFCSEGCRARFELNEGIVREGADKSWWKRSVDRLLKEPKTKPPKCH